MSQFRQFWIKDFVVFKTHERYADGASVREAYDKPAPNRKIHVIEIAALEAAQKENENLTAALKVAEDALRLMASPEENEPNWFHLTSRKALLWIEKLKKGVGMKIVSLLKYCFSRIRAAFCRHRFFYWWGVTGVDRHGLYCVKCTMCIQSIPGRKLKYYEYEMPPKEEMTDDGITTTWINPRKMK